ncbi:hypothetical protein MBLNU457_g1023t1 [Dothideomycetes sp. NU457]
MQSPPLKDLRVLEFAGLAPGPYAGMLLADYGATVLRVDRAVTAVDKNGLPHPTTDRLTRHKRSIAVDLKSPAGLELIKSLISEVDVVIDPFRPGVLEKAGLDPEKVLLQINPRLIVARMTGFRRDGKYKDMAGHDINYIAVSGILSMLGRKGETPYPPGNIVGDFAGGGLICFVGILLALLHRSSTGNGQVVEANMVDGSAHLATFPRFATQTPMWDQPRGENMLDGGSPFYDTYETKDGKYMAVGALEPHFFALLLKGLGIDSQSLPGSRDDRTTWPALKELFTTTFKSRTRDHWESVFDGTDACCTPVLTQQELKERSFDQRPIVTLKQSPGLALDNSDNESRHAAQGQGDGVDGQGWTSTGLRPGQGGDELMSKWLGWQIGKHYERQRGGLIKLEANKGSKL